MSTTRPKPCLHLPVRQVGKGSVPTQLRNRVGWAVTPRMWMRRVACSMTKNAQSRCRVIVSRWNRSQVKIACACAWRNWDQIGPVRRGDGSMPAALPESCSWPHDERGARRGAMGEQNPALNVRELT